MKTDVCFKTMSYLNTGYRIAGINFRGKTFRKVFTDLIFCGIAFASMHARGTKHLYPRKLPFIKEYIRAFDTPNRSYTAGILLNYSEHKTIRGKLTVIV